LLTSYLFDHAGSTLLTAGLVSFLRGDPQEPDIDYRGPEVPDPPVDSLEELKERFANAAVNGELTTDKKEKKQATAPSSRDNIDISKLDIRVGMITKAWEHGEADKLFCEEIDIGEADGPRQIASGLREHYNLADLEGQRVLVLANLKTRKMMGFASHGMVLCAASNDGKVQLLEPPEDAIVGERVMVDGFDGEPATENQVIKKKMLDAIFPDLQTNADGIATYKGVPLLTSAGPCKPTFPNAEVS
jgi:methionine--tRNA ligase beta chain